MGKNMPFFSITDGSYQMVANLEASGSQIAYERAKI